MRLPTSPISGSAFQERSARRISLMFLVANAIGALAYTVLAGQTQAWQVWALIGLSLALAGIGALSFWWSGRGRYQAGIVALIGATAAGGLLGSALVANVGPLLGIVVVFLSLTVAAQTLPQRMINRVLTLSSLAGLSAVVVNVLAGPTQLSVPQLQSIVPALAVMALLSFGVLIARQFRSYSFSTKLLVTLLSVVALTLGGSAAVTGQAVGRQLVDDTGKRLQSLSESKANEIGRVLQSEIGALRTLTLNKFVQDGLEAASQANPGDPAELRQRNQAWQIAAADSPLVTQVLDNDPASELREFQRSFPDHLLVAATDRWGATVAATNRVEDYYQADQAWWQAALDRGVFISQPEPAAADQPPSLIIALAVPKHDTDVIAGVLYARLSLRIFANTLATGKFGQTGRTEIYLPDGQTLALKVDNPAELVLAPGEIDLATLRQSPDGSLDDVEAGVPYLAGRMPIAAGGAIEGQGAEAVRDMGWYVVARQSRAEALQAGETTTRVTLLVTLGALIAAGLIALFVAQVLTGPIVRLTAVAAQASDGDLAVQAPIEANDEIGVLAATFNQMTVRLRETLGALEQRVAERTTQFEAANRELSARIKDQERMEAALRESAERFQTLFEASPDAIVLIDPHGPWPILDCNSAACQMNGYTREELVGQSIDILNLTRGDAAERAAYLDQLRQSSAFHLRTMHRRKDGTLFPIEVSTSLIMLGGREVVLGIDRDITEQQRAEEALRMSEERFQLVAYATNDAVWDLNLATGQRWWNAGVSSVFGYPPDQVGADQAWWEARLHPDDRDKVLASFQTALLSDGKFWSKEYRYRRADGTYAYVFDRGYIIADSHGRPLRAIGAILDLTERKRAEEEIRAEQQRVQTILETVTVPMVISRLSDSRVLYANQALSQIRRVPLEELIGSRTVDYFVNPDDREKLVDILKRQGYAVDFETQLKRSDGVASWVLL